MHDFFMSSIVTSSVIAGLDLPVVASIVLLSIALPLVYIFKSKKQRDAFWNAI